MSISDENLESGIGQICLDRINPQFSINPHPKGTLAENAPGSSPEESVSCHLLGDVPDDRQLEFFVLVRLDHADDNQHKNAQSYEREQQPDEDSQAARNKCQDDCQDPERNHDRNGAHGNSNRLSGMKANKRPLIYQQKDEPGNPTEKITKQARDIRVKTRSCCRTRF